MKRRFADGRSNKDILEKEFKNYQIDTDIFKGNVGFLNIKKVAKKWLVDEEDRCILDNNHLWIEIYPSNKNYCITVMCDENDKVVEWYFDVCKQNGIEDNVPFEDDLFLDVVIVPDGRYHLLDEDELKEALNNNDITKEEYNLAYSVANYIISDIVTNIPKLEEYTETVKKLCK